MKAALEALLDDGYTIEEAAAELGIPEQKARRELIGPLEAHQKPPTNGNGSGDPSAVQEPPRARAPHTRPQRPRSNEFRRKPRTDGSTAAEKKRAAARLLALPRGRRLELLAERMAALHGERLGPSGIDPRRRAYLALADYALEALEELLEAQRNPILLKGER